MNLARVATPARSVVVALAQIAFALAATAPAQAQAQTRKDSAVLGMVLEPTSLDPTTGAAAATDEVVQGNVFEGLTRIAMDGSVLPALAESWTIAADGATYTFKLRSGVRFHDGESFDSADVRFSFDRARAAGSTNKAKKAVFDNLARIDTPDATTVVLVLAHPDGNFLFRLGESAAAIVDPKSAAGDATRPIGTGPYKFDGWSRGTSVTLSKWDGWRNAASVKLDKVTFRFIADPAAQVAALLAGDIDAMPRFGAPQSLQVFRTDPRFTVTAGGTEGKTILAINNRRKPFDDMRVRRALAAAIDRKAVIDGSSEGFGTPIGSHMVPSDAGYVDLTATNPYDPERARALLQQAGVALPLHVTLTLPPPQYARRGGEIIASQLAKVGIDAKIENVEWAQWLAGPYKGRFDLTLVSHVEPLDFATVYADPAYYIGYDSRTFREKVDRYDATLNTRERLHVLGLIQKQLADDAVNVFLYQLPQFSVADRRLKGIWTSSPVFANDLAALAWQTVPTK